MRLIDADRAYDLIESRLDCNAGEKFDMAINMALRIVKKSPTIDAAPVVHGRWIPVTERLPETFVPVIVSRKGGKVEQGNCDLNGWWRVYGTRTKKVTHWMPLPEPPAEAALEKEGEHE